MNISQLTFTRFLAAFMILLYHFAKHDVYPFNNIYIINSLIRNGDFAVSFFFFLSGFVMIVANWKNDKIEKGTYYKNRFARIYPIYFISTVLFLLEWAVFKKEIDPANSIISLLMIQSWIPGKEIILNTPAWSLGVELFFYLLFPFLFILYKNYSYKFITAITILLFIGSQIILNLYLTPTNHDFLFYNPIFHLNTFIFGSWTAITYIKYKHYFEKKTDLIWVSVLTAMIVFVIMNKQIIIHNGFLAVFFIPIILYMSGSEGRIVKFFRTKQLVFLGEISYSMYILQFPIFIPLNRYLTSRGVDGSVNFYVCLAFLMIVSIITYKLIEIPSRKFIRSKF